MAICLPLIVHTKQILRHSLLRGKEETSMPDNVPTLYFAVYVGEEQKKRFVVPISFLNEPTFQQLLSKAEEEFGFDHPMSGLTIPCREDRFIILTSEIEYQNRKSPYQYYKVQIANKIASQQASQIKWTNVFQNCGVSSD